MSCAVDMNTVSACSFEKALKTRGHVNKIIGTERQIIYFHWEANQVWLRFPVNADEAEFISANQTAFNLAIKRILGFELPALFANLPADDPNRQPFSVVSLYSLDLNEGNVEIVFDVTRNTGLDADGEVCRYFGDVQVAKEALYRVRWIF